MMRRLEATITGRVQVVMFRDFVQRAAKRFNLLGWVKNNDDGSVSLVAEGEEADLNQLLARVYKGPVLAQVDDVKYEFGDPKGGFKHFEIRHD